MKRQIKVNVDKQIGSSFFERKKLNYKKRCAPRWLLPLQAWDLGVIIGSSVKTSAHCSLTVQKWVLEITRKGTKSEGENIIMPLCKWLVCLSWILCVVRIPPPLKGSSRLEMAVGRAAGIITGMVQTHVYGITKKPKIHQISKPGNWGDTVKV